MLKRRIKRDQQILYGLLSTRSSKIQVNEAIMIRMSNSHWIRDFDFNPAADFYEYFPTSATKLCTVYNLFL